MNSNDSIVVDLDDVRIMELMGECAALKKEFNAEREERLKIKDENLTLLHEKTKLMAKLKAEQRRSRDLQNSLGRKRGEINEVRGMKQHLERLAQIDDMDLSFNLMQEKRDFEGKKAANAKSKTDLLWQLENLWMKYESIRGSYEQMESRAKEAHGKVREFARDEEQRNIEQNEIIEKNNRLQAQVDSLEESMRLMQEKQKAINEQRLREIQKSRRDLQRKSIDLRKNREKAESLRKSTNLMANQIMDFQNRKSMFEITIRKYVVEGALGDSTLFILKNPSTREIKLRIQSSGHTLGIDNREIELPFCEISQIKILGDSRFQLHTDTHGDLSFSSPNASTIVDDFLEIKHIDLTQDRFSGPPSPGMKPLSRRKKLKRKVSKAFRKIFRRDSNVKPIQI